MPCNDSAPPDYVTITATAWQTANDMKACFCAMMRAALKTRNLDDIIKSLDLKEAGISGKRFLGIWLEHEQQDIRKMHEDATRKAALKNRKAALKKLTQAERRLLGLGRFVKN